MLHVGGVAWRSTKFRCLDDQQEIDRVRAMDGLSIMKLIELMQQQITGQEEQMENQEQLFWRNLNAKNLFTRLKWKLSWVRWIRLTL